MLVVDVWLAFLLSASTYINIQPTGTFFPQKRWHVVPSTRATLSGWQGYPEGWLQRRPGCCGSPDQNEPKGWGSANDLQLDAYCTHTVYIVSFKHAFWCILQLFLRKKHRFPQKDVESEPSNLFGPSRNSSKPGEGMGPSPHGPPMTKVEGVWLQMHQTDLNNPTPLRAVAQLPSTPGTG